MLAGSSVDVGCVISTGAGVSNVPGTGSIARIVVQAIISALSVMRKIAALIACSLVGREQETFGMIAYCWPLCAPPLQAS